MVNLLSCTMECSVQDVRYSRSHVDLRIHMHYYYYVSHFKNTDYFGNCYNYNCITIVTLSHSILI